MKVIIAGSRWIHDINLVDSAIKASEFPIKAIVSGTARGIDTCAIEWAKQNGFTEDQIHKFPAYWRKYGQHAAGFIRNRKMSRFADALIAIWDGNSRGTAHMIQCMRELDKPVYILFVEKG